MIIFHFCSSLESSSTARSIISIDYVVNQYPLMALSITSIQQNLNPEAHQTELRLFYQLPNTPFEFFSPYFNLSIVSIPLTPMHSHFRTRNLELAKTSNPPLFFRHMNPYPFIITDRLAVSSANTHNCRFTFTSIFPTSASFMFCAPVYPYLLWLRKLPEHPLSALKISKSTPTTLTLSPPMTICLRNLRSYASRHLSDKRIFRHRHLYTLHTLSPGIERLRNTCVPYPTIHTVTHITTAILPNLIFAHLELSRPV